MFKLQVGQPFRAAEGALSGCRKLKKALFYLGDGRKEQKVFPSNLVASEYKLVQDHIMVGRLIISPNSNPTLSTQTTLGRPAYLFWGRNGPFG